MDNLKIILEKYQNGYISSKIVFKKILKNKISEGELKQITDYIHQELDIHMNNKKYFNLLKSILIMLNKKNNTVKSKKKYEEELNQLLQKYIFIENKNLNINHDNEISSSIIEKDIIEFQNEDNEHIEKENQDNIYQNQLILNQFFSKYRNYYTIDFELFNQILEDFLIHSTQPIYDYFITKKGFNPIYYPGETYFPKRKLTDLIRFLINLKRIWHNDKEKISINMEYDSINLSFLY